VREAEDGNVDIDHLEDVLKVILGTVEIVWVREAEDGNVPIHITTNLYHKIITE
jgi:hypothetical protein